MTETIIPKKEGEINASDMVKYFDDVQDENGKKLVQSAKRSRIREMMVGLYNDPSHNVCRNVDGTEVPIVVRRGEPKRAKSLFLNTSDEDKNLILREFAAKTGIKYCPKEYIEPKKITDLISSEVQQIFDDVKSGDKKLSGFRKKDRLSGLFEKLYQSPKENQISTPDGNIPIIVKRIGINNKRAYCLNTEKHRREIMQAFAKWAGCIYRAEKENQPTLSEKKNGELTIRDCAKIFHNVEQLHPRKGKIYNSEKLGDWFEFIYQNPEKNKLKLPNGSWIKMVVQRQSYAQKCLCLNTSDETVKPFIFKKIAQYCSAQICMENIKFKGGSKTSLAQTVILLRRIEKQCKNSKEQKYYHAYAQKAYDNLNLKDKNMTMNEWLAKISKDKEK